MQTSGWGFCSKDCYPDQSQPFYGVAREKAIDILEQLYCERQLTEEGTKHFKVILLLHSRNFNQIFGLGISVLLIPATSNKLIQHFIVSTILGILYFM